MAALRLLILAGVAAAAMPAQELDVYGLNGTRATFTAADIAKLPQQKVATKDHDKPATFEGVKLGDVLAKVDLPLGDKFHSTAAAYYLLVEAKDGYRAVYAWAELDPGFMDKPLLLVTARDGKTLDDKAGPFQLVAPGEKRGGRWVRQVTALRILRAQ
jgi:hypothetical protein